MRGRIFISKKGIGLATISDDKELRRHLVNSGYVDEAYLSSIEAGSTTLAPLADKEAEIIDLLREMTVESLYQMSRRGSSFEVTESLTTPYASPRAFELEAILEESRRRAGEWADVEQIISDLDGVIKMNRELGDQDSVKISRDAWRLLCEMGSGASVRTLAERLGHHRFLDRQSRRRSVGPAPARPRRELVEEEVPIGRAGSSSRGVDAATPTKSAGGPR